MSITYKDEAGIAGMRTACRLASEVLDYLTPLIQGEAYPKYKSGLPVYVTLKNIAVPKKLVPFALK